MTLNEAVLYQQVPTIILGCHIILNQNYDNIHAFLSTGSSVKVTLLRCFYTLYTSFFPNYLNN